MKDLIIDYETLGNGSERDDFIILDCAFMLFDINEKVVDFSELVKEARYIKFNVDEQITKYGWRGETDTINWWKKQDKSAQQVLQASDEDQTIQDFVDAFKSYVGKIKVDRIWARGTDFDLPILKRMFRVVGDNINDTVPYWSATDIRTYVKTKTNFEWIDNNFIPEGIENTDKFIAHKCDHDITMDVLRLQYLHREFQ